jgi:hypothetical protein
MVHPAGRRAGSGGSHASGQRDGRLGQAIERELVTLAQVDLVLTAGERSVRDPVGAAALPAFSARGVDTRW